MSGQKKIGILTFHRAHNYGAVWQCYALKRACELLGHSAEAIDYNPYGHYKAIWAIHMRPSTAYRYIMFMRQFDRFVEKYLNPTSRTESHEWITTNPPQDDIYIVGSDQVWANEVVEEYLDSYLLDFAPDSVRRVAYAASTGGNPMELNEYQLGELRKFSAISLREKQSVPDVQQKVDITVADVCDPSLLLTKEDYETLEKKPFCLPKHYIVYFNLAGDPFCTEAAKQLSKQLKLPILNLVGKYKRWANYNRLAPTPEEWLYIIHHADYVCTNSFHGVCFSIIFKRPFAYCEARVQGHNKRIGRIQNLLGQTYFTNRYITDISQLSGEMINKSTDIVENAKYVEAYRNRSREWLKNAIENETDQE